MITKFSRMFIGAVIFGFLPQIVGAVSLKQRQLGESTGMVSYSDYDYGTMDYVPGADGMNEMEVISTLRHDIQLLDEEIATCERKRKGWVAATIVGGVGVVGTGIAALVQNGKIQDKKAELERVNKNIETSDKELQEAKKELHDLEKK